MNLEDKSSNKEAYRSIEKYKDYINNPEETKSPIFVEEESLNSITKSSDRKSNSFFGRFVKKIEQKLQIITSENLKNMDRFAFISVAIIFAIIGFILSKN